MSRTHNDNLRLLSEAPYLVNRAIKAGLMSYPMSQKFLADGSLDPMLLDTGRVIEQKYTDELCRRAFDLRESGMTLHDTAEECGVARGSIAYIISKGHEMYLEEQRKTMNDNRLAINKPKASGVS
jgi:hypothetical protein